MRPTITLVLFLLLGIAGAPAPASAVTPTPATGARWQETTNPSRLSPSEIHQLQTKAEAGDASAQSTLGKAYQDGNGVPQDHAMALKWLQNAADQGDAAAENNLGIMYRLGEGAVRDKVEAVRWYQKAAKHGSPQAMFNLGVSYFNGEGIGSNEFKAYVWFLLAQDAGDAVAVDAARRSAEAMSPKEISDALMQIANMYEKGEELPKSEEQTLRWLRKAAENDSRAQLRLATRLLTGPSAPHDYPEVLKLCKAAAKVDPLAQSCVGSMYRKGLGVNQDYAEALRWYQKAAAGGNLTGMLALAEMYSVGEGTKVDRPAAFLLLFRASLAGVSSAEQKASDLLRRMDGPALKRLERKLRDQHLDPKKVFQAMKAGPAS